MRKFLSKGRGILLTLAIIVAAFLLNSFSSTDIEKTAIIVALGIDYEIDTEEYLLTGQLAMPMSGGAGGSAPGQTPTMITGRGKSPAAAYHDISALSGWLPTLSFCTSVVLGNEVLQKPLMDVFDFCLRTKELNDSTLLSVYDGTAVEFFNQRTPLDEITSFSLLKIFSKENTQSSEVAVAHLKTFAMNFFRQGNGNWIPYVSPVKDVNKENKSEPDNAKSTLVDLAVDRLAVFNQDKVVAILPPELTKPFVLLSKPVNTGTIHLQDIPTENYHVKDLEVQTESKPGDISVKLEDGKIKCEIGFKTTIRLLHLESDEKSVKTLVDGHIPQEIKDAAKEKLTKSFTALVEKLQELDCDILQFEEVLYKSQPKEYKAFVEKNGQHQVLKNATFEIKVEVKARD